MNIIPSTVPKWQCFLTTQSAQTWPLLSPCYHISIFEFCCQHCCQRKGDIMEWKMKCQAQKLVTMLSSSFKEPRASWGLIESYSIILGHLISDRSMFLQREDLARISASRSKMPEKKDNVLIERGILRNLVSLWAALASQEWGKSLKATSAALSTVFCSWREKVMVPEMMLIHHVLTILATRCLSLSFQRAGAMYHILCSSYVENTCLNVPVFIPRVPWEPSAVSLWASLLGFITTPYF